MATVAIILSCWFFASCICGVVVGKMIAFGTATWPKEYLKIVERAC